EPAITVDEIHRAGAIVAHGVCPLPRRSTRPPCAFAGASGMKETRRAGALDQTQLDALDVHGQPPDAVAGPPDTVAPYQGAREHARLPVVGADPYEQSVDEVDQ